MNTLRLKKRRDTLFFGEIIADYFRACGRENPNGLEAMGEEWMGLYLTQLLPSSIKKLSPAFVVSNFLGPVWQDMGVMGNISAEDHDGTVTIHTEYEGMTELVGKNSFMPGFYKGVLGTLTGKKHSVKAKQSKGSCEYVLEPLNEPFTANPRPKAKYDALNMPPEWKGFTLREAMRQGIIKLSPENRLMFRGHVVYPIEGTMIHIMGAHGIALGKVPAISKKFFSSFVDPTASDEKKLVFLKTLLQIMGWGAPKIALAEDSITLRLDCPFHGLQSGEDNWNFFSRMVLGFIHTIRPKYSIKSVSSNPRTLIIKYA